jgi:glycosyltransferase involved in cell wall biosynthesis
MTSGAKIGLGEQRPKVCHIIHDGKSQSGGGTLSISYFPPYLAEFDTIAIAGNNGDIADDLRAAGVRTFTLAMDRPWRAVLTWPSLWNILRREKPDAVILHGQWAGLFGALAARAAGVPVIFYYAHFPSFYTDWDVLRTVRNRLAEGITCRLVTKVVCLSHASRQQYLVRRLAEEEKLVYIPNAASPVPLLDAAARQALRRELDLPEEKEGPLVISVSRLTDQKRLDWLLRAWKTVEASGTNAQLILVGGGVLESELRELAEQLGLKRYKFLGPRSAGRRYYEVADLGVISSMYEALSLSLIEAMFSGCPMVGTAVDGIAELIDSGRTGLLVPPADPPALAEAIVALLKDPARARSMGEAAREDANRFYRLETTIQRQIKLLKDELALVPAR